MSANEQLNQLNPEDFPLLLGAILSERVLSARRELGEDGRWRWEFPNPKHTGEGEPETLRADEPPLVVDDSRIDDVIYLLSNLAANGQPFHWAFGRKAIPPEFAARGCQQWYGCRIFLPDGSGQVVSEAGAEVMSFSIALAVVKMTGADLPTIHREMFPHRYLVLNS